MKTDKIMRMKELVNEIREEDIAYYKYDDPKLTDREYDLLVEELMDLEAETGVILSDSPTQKVSGEILEGLMPVQHTKPMLSADKTKSVEDLVRFAKDRDVLLSWKLDGLTLVLRYADGKFRQAITRGKDGIIGEDVTVLFPVRAWKVCPSFWTMYRDRDGKVQKADTVDLSGL